MSELGPFSTDSAGGVGGLMSASARKRRTGAGPGALRSARPRDSNSPNWGLESCATNLPIMNGLPSSRCCRTSRVAFPGLTTGVSSMASSGSCDQEHPGVICRRHPYTTCYNRFVRWRRAGVWGRIIDALAAAHDAAVQMIDTSIVRVHQHGACITRNQRQSMGRSRGGLTSKIHEIGRASCRERV